VWNCRSQEMLGDPSLFMRAGFIEPRCQITSCSFMPLSRRWPSAISCETVYTWNWRAWTYS